MPRHARSEIRAYGIRALLSRHPEIRKLKRRHSPSVHGNRLWSSSWLLMDYFRRHGLPEESRVMEIGCGWGLAAIYCAKKYGALVTGADIDEEVFPFVDLHARINKVEIATMRKGFDGIRGKELDEIDILIGADICFWGPLADSLRKLIRRALRRGVRSVLIADPGRSPFEDLAAYFSGRPEGIVLDWSVKHPRPIDGRILKVAL